MYTGRPSPEDRDGERALVRVSESLKVAVIRRTCTNRGSRSNDSAESEGLQCERGAVGSSAARSSHSRGRVHLTHVPGLATSLPSAASAEAKGLWWLLKGLRQGYEEEEQEGRREGQEAPTGPSGAGGHAQRLLHIPRGGGVPHLPRLQVGRGGCGEEEEKEMRFTLTILTPRR